MARRSSTAAHTAMPIERVNSAKVSATPRGMESKRPRRGARTQASTSSSAARAKVVNTGSDMTTRVCPTVMGETP